MRRLVQETEALFARVRLACNATTEKVLLVFEVLHLQILMNAGTSPSPLYNCTFRSLLRFEHRTVAHGLTLPEVCILSTPRDIQLSIRQHKDRHLITSVDPGRPFPNATLNHTQHWIAPDQANKTLSSSSSTSLVPSPDLKPRSRFFTFRSSVPSALRLYLPAFARLKSPLIWFGLTNSLFS